MNRFAATRDEIAFAALVERHGPMVLGVCRRLLKSHQDAEDAFQVTFLILAQKAAGVAKPGAIGKWLYGVACRVSLRLRKSMHRRQRREIAHIEARPTIVEASDHDEQVREVVDEELLRLPQTYRDAIVLCYLEGKTNEQASLELGCPVGTVFSRLARGRERLRAQLASRGLGVPAAALATLLAAESTQADVSPALLGATVSASKAFVTGASVSIGTASAAAIVLARAALRSTFAAKLATALILVTLSGIGGLVVSRAVKMPRGSAIGGAPTNPVHWAEKSAVIELPTQNAEKVAADSQPQAAQKQKPRPKEGQTLQEQSAARLKLMKETATRIQLRVAENAQMLKLETQPVIRWDNHGSFIVDAVTFIWLDEHRPQVIGGMWIKNGHAFFDLQSLSARPLSARVDGAVRWSTSRRGILWQAIMEAPPSAASRVERLRQMKQLAEAFSVYAVKTAPDYDEGSLWHLRMMSRPVYRYAEEAAVDGAIFAFTQGTDPEAFLILESRHEDGGSRWHFAIAPACVWELHAQRGDREVWSRPKWNHQDTDTVYGLVGPFAVDADLFPPESTDSTPAPKHAE